MMKRTNNYATRNNAYRTNGSSYGAQTHSSSYSTHSSSYSRGKSIDIPQASGDDEAGYSNGMRRNTTPKRGKSATGGRSCMFTFLVLVVIVMVGGYSLVVHHERKMLKAQLVEQDATMRELEMDLSMKFDSKIKKLNEENTKLKHQMADGKELKVENQNLKTKNKSLQVQVDNEKGKLKNARDKHKVELERLRNEKSNSQGGQVNQLSNAKTKLQQNIQLMSKTALMEKYGPGPHLVEMHLRFDSHLGRDDGGIITLEMAPIDELPHAVYWFLEQVSRKLYDGSSFHRNAGHVIQGGAAPNFLTPENHRPNEQSFRDAGFHSILFQEYSNKFPHVKYTLGYAGRPGGPDFYINTKDNSKIHGPGGQRNYDDPSEADTCFAKVIDGFDLVDRMHGLPVKEGDYRALVDNVAIVSMRRK